MWSRGSCGRPYGSPRKPEETLQKPYGNPTEILQKFRRDSVAKSYGNPREILRKPMEILQKPTEAYRSFRRQIPKTPEAH